MQLIGQVAGDIQNPWLMGDREFPVGLIVSVTFHVLRLEVNDLLRRESKRLNTRYLFQLSLEHWREKVQLAAIEAQLTFPKSNVAQREKAIQVTEIVFADATKCWENDPFQPTTYDVALSAVDAISKEIGFRLW